MVKFIKELTRNWPIAALLFFSLLLSFLNYQPGTWLTGWDNLHPEFNFPLNIKRSLDVAWQEYQSLGLLGGMAHAADLPRQLVLWGLSSTPLPLSSLRYIWTFTMLVIGPLGAYFLAQHTLLKRFGVYTKRLAAFFAGLFYLLNLATVQTFYTPFEAFVSFYGFLPWLLLAPLLYLNKPSRTNLFFLITTLLLSSPSFYIQTLFVVYVICLIPFLIYHLFTKQSYVSIFTFLVVLISTQAYWLFPVAYFSLTTTSTTVNSLQNQIATPEIIDRNQEFGTIDNIALLKGFWFKYGDLGPNDQFQFLPGPWVSHLNNSVIKLLGFVLFSLVLIGLVYSLKRKLTYSIPLTIFFLLTLFFLINNNPPTGIVFDYLRDHFTIFNQSFRSVFTKWSTATSLGYSLFFSVGVIFLLDIFSFLHDRFTITLTYFSLIFLLLSFTGPAFSGHLIYSQMRQNIPSEYSQLFEFFKNQNPNSRIANFPQHTFWGWEFYNWGYRGSGFLWYGINQPILDRAFDVWSPYSENYYTDIKPALYGQNQQQFEFLLEKYSINWILVDNSVIAPGTSDQTSLYIRELKQLLDDSNKVTLAKSFGKVDVYQVNLESAPNNYLSTTTFDQNITQQLHTPIITDTVASNHSVDPEKSKNCDPLATGLHTKEILGTEVKYTSQGANECDHFLYPSVQLNRPYQIKIEHKNLAGQPLLYCIEPYSSKTCLLYGYLPKSPDWTSTTLTLPALNPKDYGFTIHLFNYSLGNVYTQNSWREIQIFPMSSSTTNQIKTSPLELSSISHPTYSLYALNASSNQPNASLVLNQGFDAGWKAFRVDERTLKQSPFFQYLKSLMLIPLPENSHLIGSSWNNTWTLPQGNHHLLIVFMPQHLQYLGLSLLLLLPIIFFLHKRNH